MLNRDPTDQIARLRRELDTHAGRQASPAVTLAETVARLVANQVASRSPDAAPARRPRGLGSMASLLAAGLSGIIALLRRRPRRSSGITTAIVRPAVETATPGRQLTDVTRNFLVGFVLPVWLAAGLADWFCHRRARIERNAGSTESALHLLMLGEAALPVLAGLFLEITSPVLLLMFAAVIVHAATALCDVSYAVKRREVTPVEQHVHSYLEMVPVMAVSFISVLHWPELRALLGRGDRSPDWTVRRKRTPLPAGIVAALLVLEVGPYLEEFRRTLRSRR